MNIILIPTYNERDSIQSIIPEVFTHCPEVKVIVIDDNSPDGTRDAVRNLQKKYPNLSLFEREKKEGLGRAYIHAMKHCLAHESFDAIITMDADGSHDPSHLPAMLESVKRYGLVIGSRYVKGGGVSNWSLKRRMLSKFGNVYARMITGLKVHDLTAGFVAVQRNILEKIDFSNVHANGYSYQIEFKYICIKILGASFLEIPITFVERREGVSKMSGKIIEEAVKVPWLLRKRTP